MKPRVYIETSVFSYLTARDSASLVGSSRQLLTRRWWERRDEYSLFVSEVVIRECKDGDATAAQRRLNAVGPIPLLSLTPQAADLATLLITQNIMPATAAEDAIHIAIAAVHQVDFLLSWNFMSVINKFDGLIFRFGDGRLDKACKQNGICISTDAVGI